LFVGSPGCVAAHEGCKNGAKKQKKGLRDRKLNKKRIYGKREREENRGPSGHITRQKRESIKDGKHNNW